MKRICLVVIAALLWPALLQAEPTYPDARWLDGWRKIVLTGRKYLLAHGRVTLTVAPTAWRPPADPGGAPRPPGVAAIFLGTEIQMSILGVKRAPTLTESFLDAGTLRALEYRELKTGKSTKRLQFLDDAYRLVRTKPPAGRRGTPRQRWETYADEMKPYRFPDGEPLPDGARPHDSYSLLYLVMHAAQQETIDGAEYVIITRGNLLPVRVKTGRERERVRTVRDLATGRRRKLRLREREIRLVSLGGDSWQGEDLSAKGEVEIWVEAETGTILEISGNIPGVGSASLKLKSVEPAGG